MNKLKKIEFNKKELEIIENKVKSFYGADYSENIFLKSMLQDFSGLYACKDK